MNIHSQKTPPLPRLIGDHGQPQFGRLPAGVEEINYRDYDLRTVMDRPRGALARWLGFNRFQFISLMSPELILGVAIVDLRLAGHAFVFAYEPSSGALDDLSFVNPLALGVSIDERPNTGMARFRRGRRHITIHADGGQRHLNIEIPGTLTLQACIQESAGHQALSVCSRAGYQGWAFTQKSNALPVHGTLHWRGRERDLAEVGALAGVDWSGGFMRRETAWNWASLSTRLQDGRPLGLNLAAGVNETGVTENALWLQGIRHDLAGVAFDFQRYQPAAPWRLRDEAGRVDLEFRPRQSRQEKVQALILASNFRQHVGTYHGFVQAGDERIALDGDWGLIEDHYAKW